MNAHTVILLMFYFTHLTLLSTAHGCITTFIRHCSVCKQTLRPCPMYDKLRFNKSAAQLVPRLWDSGRLSFALCIDTAIAEGTCVRCTLYWSLSNEQRKLQCFEIFSFEKYRLP